MSLKTNYKYYKPFFSTFTPIYGNYYIFLVFKLSKHAIKTVRFYPFNGNAGTVFYSILWKSSPKQALAKN